jgi:TetR/AcrR family transcriptional regulator, regulator of cefoperazone and chloramphenicol sensitivity
MSESGKTYRSDGVEARNRLLDAALQLFAETGFAKTSTRQIAQAAQVNIASISYYFGDKAGLYRAVFRDPRRKPRLNATTDATDATLPDQPGVTLRESLQGLLVGFTDPLKQGDVMQCCMRLHFREMLEPTGVWQEEIDTRIKPAHASLVGVLCRHLGVAQADDDVHRLAFSIVGLGINLFVARDVMQAIRPELIASDQAIDDYTQRLVDCALAMVENEARRRKKIEPVTSKP